VTFEEVRRMALSLPGVIESASYGTPAFKLGTKLLARLREDGQTLVVGTTFGEREELQAAEPEIYFLEDHYLNYPWVLVRLPRIHPDALRDLLSRALRLASDAKRGKAARATVRRAARQ
jgi:hypothetical protein